MVMNFNYPKREFPDLFKKEPTVPFYTYSHVRPSKLSKCIIPGSIQKGGFKREP